MGLDPKLSNYSAMDDLEMVVVMLVVVEKLDLCDRVPWQRLRFSPIQQA